VRGLLVIERGPKPEGELTSLSQSEAAHHLVKAVIKSPTFQFEQALRDMLRLSGQVRAYRLRSSTPEGAGARALEWLEKGMNRD
jgi:glycerol kinase